MIRIFGLCTQVVSIILYYITQFTLAEAARAKADGISLLVIGIGRKVRMSELSLIADSSSHAIHLNDFKDLNGDAALQRLTDAMQGLY